MKFGLRAQTMQTRLLAPLILLLICFATTFGFLAWSFQTEYLGLRDNLSLNAEVERHASEVARIRTRTQELLLLFRLKRDASYLNELQLLNSMRLSHLDRIRWLTRNDPKWNLLGKSVVGGLSESLFLQNEMIRATKNGQLTRADEAFHQLSTIFEINSARLKDFAMHLENDLYENERVLQSLLVQTFWMLALSIGLTAMVIWLIAIFYRRHVLSPMKRLQNGLRSLSRGEMEAQVAVGSAPRELQEMTADFNEMASRLRATQLELTNARETAVDAAHAKSDFLSNMSHEIRTPLNTIIGMADELVELPLPGAQKKYAEVLGKSGQVLLNIVNDILDFSKLEAGNIKLADTAFDLRELSSRVSDVVAVTARRKNLEFNFEFSPDRPAWLRGDPKRIEQIILNLLGNAVKFTDRGRVGFHVAASQSGDEMDVQMRVTDTGVGIEAADIASIFERFSQTEMGATKKYGGTGLGLAIVKQLAELMRGKVSVKSEIGNGSEFTVSLRFPIAEASLIKNRAETPAKIRLEAPGEMDILLVDDSAENRFLIQTYLKQTPVRITTAEDGRQGVELFAQGFFDLVLMDMQMPVLDGYHATARIRELERATGRRRTPIIALTAYALAEEIERSHRAGCDLHLTKPIRKNSLFEAMNQFIPERRPLGADL